MNLLVFNEHKMDSTPLKKGFLPTSTPIQSLCDSGFFGSCHKSIGKILHTLSPVKESSPSKKRYNELNQLTKTYSLETPRLLNQIKNTVFEDPQNLSNELAKELDFNNLSDFSESFNNCFDESEVGDISDYKLPSLHKLDEFFSPKNELIKLHHRHNTSSQHWSSTHKSLSSTHKPVSSSHRPVSSTIKDSCYPNKVSKILFSPVVVDNSWKEKLPSVKIQNKKIDFLGELSKHNCDFIVTSILSSLSPDDLCRICCVSKKYKSIVLRDVKANCRRKEFIREERDRKENKPSKTSSEVQKTKQTLAGERKTVLSDVTNTVVLNKQPLETQNSRFESFIKEGQTLKSGVLMKCPSCQYAAKGAEGGDEFCCTKCTYTFCRKCLSPFLKNHSCSKTKVSILIGSKRSKRSLKRL